MHLHRRLIALAGPARGALALAVVLGLAGGAAAVGQARLLAQVIARVFLDGADRAAVALPLALLLAVIVARALSGWGAEVAAHRGAARVKLDLRRTLLRKLFGLGPAFAEGERAGELANTVTQGVEAVETYFREYFPQVALAAGVPLMVAGFVLVRDPLSALILLVTAPLIPAFLVLIGKLAARASRRQWEALGRLGAHFLDVIQGLTTLKILGRSRDQAREIRRVTDEFRDRTMAVLRVAFLSAFALELLSTLSTALVAVEVGLRLLYGRLAFEEAFFVLLLAPEFYLPLRMLGNRFHAGMAGVSAANRIFEILGTSSSRVVPAGTPGGSPLRRSALELRDIHYAYPADTEDVGRLDGALRGVSLRIAPGEHVAVVGPSGSGKSTLAKIILGFVVPDQGEVLVDGLPLASIGAERWLRSVAWLPQEPHLFHDTIAANIRLGRPEASEAEVRDVARRALADRFIRLLPEGYDTVVGERGAHLSGGQAQRIALARAFLQNANLLLLDEAVTGLDPELEEELGRALERLLRGRSALILAHRLSTVVSAHRVVVLSEGRNVQEGTHAELARREGLYRRLVSAHGGAS